MKACLIHDGTDTCKILSAELADGLKGVAELVEVRPGRPKGFLLESLGGLHEFLGDPVEVKELVSSTGADIVIVHLSPLSGEAMDSIRVLKLICSARSSAVNVDVKHAINRGIPVIACPGRNARAVAEFTVGMMLCLSRSIHSGNDAVKSGRWTPELKRNAMSGPELEGKVLGLIGLGSIGRTVASIAGCFGMEVWYFDDYVAESSIAKKVSLRQLLESSDFVSLHMRVGGNPARPMIGAEELALMKKGAYLINTARGSLIDEKVLADALKSGHLAGAALDTFEAEPLDPASPMIGLPNALLTPHIAGNSNDQARHSARMLIADIIDFAKTGNVNEAHAERG